MARARMIARSLSTSRKYAALHLIAGPLAEFCQAMYPLLVAHADDWGRLAGDEFTIKHAIVPTSPRPEADIARALECLDTTQLIRWYSADGRNWIQIQQFDEHQSGLHKRTTSAIPPPPRPDSPDIPGTPGISGSRARAELKGTEGKGIERKGKEGNPKGREGKGTRSSHAKKTERGPEPTNGIRSGLRDDSDDDLKERLRRLKETLRIESAPMQPRTRTRRRSRHA
jgi:hypothetical protein